LEKSGKLGEARLTHPPTHHCGRSCVVDCAHIPTNTACALYPYVLQWDTLPVFFHSSNSSGPYNEESVRLMAKFPMVTVEKFQG
jgi:hypothetical protein